jgi:type II secretory pathway pseudopilin PulG
MLVNSVPMADSDFRIDTKRASRQRSTRRAGVSLVETAAVISLAGVLTAAFVPTFTRHLRLSKTAEAVEQLETMQRGLDAYYRGEPVNGQPPRQFGCLPESAGPFPAQPSDEPQTVNYDADETPNRDTWQLLGLSGEVPLRYSYELVVAQPGCGPRLQPTAPVVRLRALGDLDGDGVLSTLERASALSGGQRELEPHGPLHVHHRVE